MKRRNQILVVGYSGEHCSDDVRGLAFEIGKEVAKHGAILMSGGLNGVMEASCRGAKEENGQTVCIIPKDDMGQANKFCDIVIPTGIGFARDFITAHSADAVIVVGGGVGTLIEVCVAYLDTKPIVALRGSGGTADKIADTYLDDRERVRIYGADNPHDAVEKAISLIRNDKEKRI